MNNFNEVFSPRALSVGTQHSGENNFNKYTSRSVRGTHTQLELIEVVLTECVFHGQSVRCVLVEVVLTECVFHRTEREVCTCRSCTHLTCLFHRTHTEV